MESPTVGHGNQSQLVQQSAKWKEAVKLKRHADKMPKDAPLSDGWCKKQEMYMMAGLKFLEAAEVTSRHLCVPSGFTNSCLTVDVLVRDLVSEHCFVLREHNQYLQVCRMSLHCIDWVTSLRLTKSRANWGDRLGMNAALRPCIVLPRPSGKSSALSPPS